MSFLVYFAKSGEMSRAGLSSILALHVFMLIGCSAMVRTADSGLSLFMYRASTLTALFFCVWIALLLLDLEFTTKKKRYQEKTRAHFFKGCTAVVWVWLCMVSSTVSALAEKGIFESW